MGVQQLLEIGGLFQMQSVPWVPPLWLLPYPGQDEPTVLETRLLLLRCNPRQTPEELYEQLKQDPLRFVAPGDHQLRQHLSQVEDSGPGYPGCTQRSRLLNKLVTTHKLSWGQITPILRIPVLDMLDVFISKWVFYEGD
jgi:hypothetical protein